MFNTDRFWFGRGTLSALLLWVVAGLVCAMTYQTDAAPEFIVRREAITAGLLCPIFLAGGIANNFAGGNAGEITAFGSLTLMIVATAILVSRRSNGAVLFSAALLAGILTAGIFLLLRSHTVGHG